MNIIDHIGLQVSDYPRALSFYTHALAPLGIAVIMRVTKEETGGYEGAGLGRDGKPSFWIGTGGRDNGAPGLRPQYHADYYGAFVLDPDGHNIEAVCRRPAS